MFLYFYAHDTHFFEDLLCPLLARSHREQGFVACHELCRFLLTQNADIPADSLIRAVLTGLGFDRTVWRGLVGECLVHGAREIPRIPAALETLCCLLAPDHFGRTDLSREEYAPIQQAHLGSRCLRFGAGYYRPEYAGLNATNDVSRIAQYLDSVDPGSWSPNQLMLMPDLHDEAERSDELAYVRDWWPSLVGLYQKARDRAQIVICEQI